MMRARIDWFVVLTAVFLAVGCGGGGCGGCAGMEPIPGGFPSAKRSVNAGQIRVTPTALGKITADPAGVIGPLAGSGSMNGVVTFPVPASCGGSTEICCKNGQPDPNCGPIQINLNKIGNEADRLTLTPVDQGNNNGVLNVQILARIKTVNDLSITYSGSHCTIDLDTTRDNTPPDLKITTSIHFDQDPQAGTTRIVATGTSVTQLDSGDYSLGGDFLCYIAGALVPASVIEDQLKGPIEDAINGATCKSCSTVADCSSPFATACTGGECQQGNQCLQELGLNGRLRGSVLFASLSPGTTGAMDLYEVAGGYSQTNASGLSLGLLGGMQPGGAARDRCGPPATEPAAVSITKAPLLTGGQDTYNGAPFDVAIGIHKSQLGQLAFAGYDGGLFCLTIGSSFAAQLSTDTIGLLSRSLGKLVEENSPMAVGLRPQAPPTITLGKNTFKDDGSGNMVVDEPLLDIKFTALELDFFASIDDQYNRVFTVVTDVHLPIGLQTTSMGELTPVIGNPMDAFTNVSVKNSDAITESPAEIAGLFPTLLGLVLPQLSGGLGSIALPALGGLALSVTAVTSVANDEFLGIIANLVKAPAMRPVDTHVEIMGIAEPPDSIARHADQWRTAKPPAVTLGLSGDMTDLEYSYRVDNISWSAWSPSAKQIVSPRVFWLPGVHILEVRARQIGHPETMDLTPERIELPLGTGVPLEHGGTIVQRTNDFHGQAGASGCSCDARGGGASNGALFALVLGLVLVPMRRVRRRLKSVAREAIRLGPLVWLAAIAMLPGCSCGSPCGDADCVAGDIDPGAFGRYTSIAADDKRVLVATYDQVYGDLVVVTATDPAKLKFKAVDGVPEDVTPTHDPDSSYRGGVEDPGPNVGAWTSIALSGVAMVSYQDRDEGLLKFAYETKAGGSWKSYAVDTSDTENGLYSSIAIDGDQKPAIAYMALGIDDGMGHRNAELRLVRAKSATPTQAGDWTQTLIASAPASCGGLCGSDACVEGAAAGDPQVCVTPTTDCGTSCSSSDACVMGACRPIVEAPKVLLPPGGAGAYVSLVTLPDGRLAAVYYNAVKRALMLSVEGSKNGNDFTETKLDGDIVGADRGMWCSATVGGDGTIHVAYQDALGDQLMYTSWNNTPGTPALVDDGQRPGDRTHPVGSGSSIYLVGGEPVIAYQDGLTSDVYLAARAGGAWTTQGLAMGPLLDGFSIAATVGHGTPVLAWGQMDPAKAPPPNLVVRSP
ncbi:MAG TPA: hypothetical protein VL326_23665 [Kofleriaceae bacterium]|nr:hypothetical protein [Kofleriaceae bacterium]